MNAAGGDLALEVDDPGVEPRLPRRRPDLVERARDLPHAIGGDLQLEPVDGLVEPGPGLTKRRHQDQRRQAAEVGAGARHRRVAGAGQRHRAVDDLPAEQALVEGAVDGLLDRCVEGAEKGPSLGLDPVEDAPFAPARLDPQPDLGGERRAHPLPGLAHAERPLDQDREGRLEDGGDARLVEQALADDLLLDLAVERDGEVAADLAHVDEGVLVGHLAERVVKATPLLGPDRPDHRLQRRGGEVPAVRREGW